MPFLDPGLRRGDGPLRDPALPKSFCVIPAKAEIRIPRIDSGTFRLAVAVRAA